jgi:histone H3
MAHLVTSLDSPAITTTTTHGVKSNVEKHKIILNGVKKTPSKGKVTKPVAKKSSEPRIGGVKKPHRFRPGTVANREIRKYQSGTKATELLIPKAAVQRLVKEIMATRNAELRLGKKALALLQLALEDEVLKQMQITNESAIHAGRITIQPKDMLHANRVRDIHPGASFPNGGGAGGIMMPCLYQDSKPKKEKKAKHSEDDETDASSTTTV